MTSRERVLAAIEKRPADRIPFYMWFHPDTTRTLAAHLDVDPKKIDDILQNDVRQTWVNNNYAMEGIVHARDGEGHVDRWGIEWIRRFGFNQIERFPLRGADRDDVLAYEFPRGSIEELMRPMERTAAECGDRFLGCDVSPCGFEMYWRLRGMDDALMDFAVDVSLAETMIERCADFAEALSSEAITRFDPDWLWTGDDVASQQGMIISPDQWRRVVKPHLERVFKRGLDAGIPVAYHCCGALGPIIPDLIEMGCGVLNPIQPGCPGMSPASLKAEYGDRLTFMGGVDTQELVPTGTPTEVRRLTEELIDIMTRDGGGYILAAGHSIPPETPIENIFALYRAAGVTEEEIRDRASDERRRASSSGRPA